MGGSICPTHRNWVRDNVRRMHDIRFVLCNAMVVHYGDFLGFWKRTDCDRAKRSMPCSTVVMSSVLVRMNATR